VRQALPMPLRSCRRSQAVASGPMLPVVAHRLRLLAAHITAPAITPHALGRGFALIASHSCTLGHGYAGRFAAAVSTDRRSTETLDQIAEPRAHGSAMLL
jgi:hypothetical protein